MTDYVDLAIKYGGYTSLDRVYLTNLLSTIPEELRLRVITPPKCDQRLFRRALSKEEPQGGHGLFLGLESGT